MTIDTIREKLRRRAIVMDIGGFRPPDTTGASWFGHVDLCSPGEKWPVNNGRPMIALCQINLTDLEFRPPRLDDVDLITVFIDSEELPDDTPNGEGWCLRAYRDIESLVPIDSLAIDSHIKPFPMRSRVVEMDYPCWEDIPIELPEDVDDKYRDLFENVDGYKLGGWPTLIQSEIYWAPFNKHPAVPMFVFQIDTAEKSNWAWGDGGVGYFGRGTAPGMENEWAMVWQCL